jgi:hypothetical protein
MHHLTSYVQSLDEAIRSMDEAGVELLQLGRGFGLDRGGGFAYFDIQSRLGVLVEGVERPARRREPEPVIP